MCVFRKPTPAKQPTPAPVPTPSPMPQRPSEDPWVPFRKEATRLDPKPTGLKEPIDLYIDSVRFIPDNATFIKVKYVFICVCVLQNVFWHACIHMCKGTMTHTGQPAWTGAVCALSLVEETHICIRDPRKNHPVRLADHSNPTIMPTLGIESKSLW